MLTEYLFVDQKRLDTYASQISPAGTIVEKTKEWNAGLSLTGPSVGAKQTERVRALTAHEKTQLIQSHLVKNSSLREQRPVSEGEGPVFVLEKCSASKVVVPRKAAEELGALGFVFWISPGPQYDKPPGMLCLLEDFDLDDAPAISFRGASTYTVLQSLVFYTRKKMAGTVLGSHIPRKPNPNPFASFEGKPDSLAEFHNVQEFCWDFVADFTSLLTRWGCLVSPPRKIETLYRIREYGRDATNSWQVTTVFGYPIWITVDAELGAARERGGTQNTHG
jgi:hypothetical protein